jgi:imidazolonepropionase-like amidohydrolase/Tol biopolymer transport system component
MKACAIVIAGYALTFVFNSLSAQVSACLDDGSNSLFKTTEGTWMNLDISPDGKTIVFDLLGNIYSLPVSGGKATVLRNGSAWEVQPRFSPDGRFIAFTSDFGGGDNIWVMAADGSQARPVTKETFRLLNNPAWSPDGKFLLARKHFTATRSLGAGEIWLYSIAGGEGIQLTTRKNDQQDVNEPVFSPCGRYVYFSEDVYPGGYFKYNKDPNSEIYVIKRLDLNDRKIETFISGPGGAIRPQPSPDGKYLAFVRRIRTRTALFIRNLETGVDKLITDSLSKDQQEAWAIFGPYTGYAWSPDSRSLFIASHGQIQRVDPVNGKMFSVPFEAEVVQSFCPTLKVNQEAIGRSFNAKALRSTQRSPDGELWATHAGGYIWLGNPQTGFTKLNTEEHLAFEPAFSADGNFLTYVTWDDVSGGSLWILDLKARKREPFKLTTERGIYRQPQFSADGKRIVFMREGPNSHMGEDVGTEKGIFWIPAKGGKAVQVSTDGEFPQFSRTGERIYYQTGGHLFGALEKAMHSIRPDGFDKVTHVKSTYANRFLPSPDGKWLAFTELHKVYVIPFPATKEPLTISGKMKSVPLARVSEQAGIALQWSSDSKSLHWTLGNKAYTASLTELFPWVLSPLDSSKATVSIQEVEINIELKSDYPKGTLLAFTGCRIISMGSEGVIEDGVLIVREDRIEAIGKRGSVTIPSDAKQIDCGGLTLMPGLVDVHAHTGNFRHGISPQQQWEYLANLAFGVTTTHDPSANTEMVFAQAEALRSGAMFGPRLFSTGTILYGADGDFKAEINSLEDARRAIQRNKAFGAFSVKSYNQPRREQRQWVMQAAREENILVVPEGGSFFYHNLNMLLDGHTGIEHNLPVAPLYSDVIQFWAQTRAGNTPTLIVNYGGVNGEFYWYQHTEVWNDKHLLQFVPRELVDSRSRHRTMIPEEEYENGHILVAKSCKKLWDAGVNIHLGSHGQMQGIGAHWELWMLVQGGFTPLEALEAGTLRGAQYLGLQNELGSLEPGKLADIVFVRGKPDEDIFQSRNVEQVMLNGRLYDAFSLNEMYTGEKLRKPMHWELNRSHTLPWHTYGSGCTCGKH